MKSVLPGSLRGIYVPTDVTVLPIVKSFLQAYLKQGGGGETGARSSCLLQAQVSGTVLSRTQSDLEHSHRPAKQKAGAGTK